MTALAPVEDINVAPLIARRYAPEEINALLKNFPHVQKRMFLDGVDINEEFSRQVRWAGHFLREARRVKSAGSMARALALKHAVERVNFLGLHHKYISSWAVVVVALFTSIPIADDANGDVIVGVSKNTPDLKTLPRGLVSDALLDLAEDLSSEFEILQESWGEAKIEAAAIAASNDLAAIKAATVIAAESLASLEAFYEQVRELSESLKAA